MSYQSYKEVSHLNPNTLHQLLVDGDPVERLWAAWALGITQGAGTLPDLNIRLHEEPEPGIRRHLLVVFAGQGENTILRVFAQDDPDAYVRATACQYLIRINPEMDDALHDFIRLRLLSDSAHVVRRTILTDLPVNFPALRFEDITNLVNDEDIQVRKLTVDHLLGNSSLSEQHLLEILENRIRDETDCDLLHELLDLYSKSGGSLQLLKLSYTLDAERRLEILDYLLDLKETFTWEYLAPLSINKDPFCDALLAQLLLLEQTIRSTQWLLEILIRAHHWPQSRNQQESKLASAVRTSAWWAEKHLIAFRTEIKSIQKGKLDNEIIQNAISYLNEGIQETQWDYEHEWDADDEWYRQAIKERRELIAALKHVSKIA